MTELFLRMLWVLARSVGRSALSLTGESVVRFRVMPSDLDFNGHMNNGRYLSLMDIGRGDWLARTGLLRHVLARRWKPLAGSATIRFRRSLRPFASYTLHTRIVCWDEKWFFAEQRFESDGKLCAVGVVKFLFREGGSNVPPTQVLALAGASTDSPPMPDAVSRWLQAGEFS